MTTKSKLFQVALTIPRIDRHAHFHSPIPEIETYTISEQEMDSVATIRSQHYHTIAVGAEVLYGIIGALLLKNKHRLCFCDFLCTDLLEKSSCTSAKFLRLHRAHSCGSACTSRFIYFISGLERVHGRLNNIEDLLSVIESAMKKWKANEVVGMKVVLTYHDHGLNLRNPSHEQAKKASTNENE